MRNHAETHCQKKLVTKSLQIGSSSLHWILWFWFNGLLYPTNRSPFLIISFTNYSILCLFFRFIFILFCQNIRRYETFGASGFYVYANQESVCIWFHQFFLPWEEYFFGDINSKEQLCISPFKTIMYADSLATFGYVKSNKRI